MKLLYIKPIREWPRWPWALWLLYFVIIVILNVFAMSLATTSLVLILLLVAVGFLIVVPIVAYVRFRSGQRERAVRVVLVPVFIGVVLISTPLAEWVGDLGSFCRVRGSMQHQVDGMSAPDEEKLVVVVTDGFLDTGHGFVYDGSDEVARPAGKQSEAWKIRAHMTELEDMCFDASHITGHFYSFITTHGCD